MNPRSRALAASLAASLAALPALAANAAPVDASYLSAHYADWAGSRENAEAIVTGLRTGSPITIVTSGANRSVSLAGFTPASAMSYGQVNGALASAQRSLAHVGITRPTAEEIQAALIGGEVVASGGRPTLVKGSVVARATAPGPVASR
jgi:hypothetical protein